MRGALAVAVGVLAFVAGCGGSGGGGGDRLSREEFQSQANAICEKYQKQLDALPQPQSIDDLPDAVSQALTLIDRQIEEIGNLNPPEEFQEDFDAMMEQADKTRDAANDLSEAAKDQDQQGIQDAIEQGQTASQEADNFASNLGLDACKG